MSVENRIKHTVHRWRHTNWVPSPIKSISCDSSSKTVAVGREDGDIQLLCPDSKWHTIAWIHGQTDFKLQQLVWSIKGSSRLFGVSLRGFIFEVDCSKLEMKNIEDCYGGAAWCISASKNDSILAVGCEDGTVRIFSYENDGNIDYVRTLQTTGSRILCIAFHPELPQIYMGCDDGTIRCVDVTTGRSIFRMTGDTLRGTRTRIWSIIVLKDSTVISGDSRGHVQFWDGEVGVLMATIQQHNAEVLALVASPDESQVFASGTDSRVTWLKKVNIIEDSMGTKGVEDVGDVTTENNKDNVQSQARPTDNQWVHTTSQRPHSHDVFSLAVIADDDGGRLVSGGLDCKVSWYSISAFGQTRPTWVLPVPASGLVNTLLQPDCKGWSLVRQRHRLDLWSLNGRVDVVEQNLGQHERVT
mmetsp:Transcript_8253/g.8419  ORF Transcript_8253/g.8419 Transcript_8253/m.8419 type:complete len:414 (+) Transcript_8253:91-1332(+)